MKRVQGQLFIIPGRGCAPASSGRGEPVDHGLELVEDHTLRLGQRARHPFVAGGQGRVGVAQLELEQGKPEPGLAETMVESEGRAERLLGGFDVVQRQLGLRDPRQSQGGRRRGLGSLPVSPGFGRLAEVKMRDGDPVGEFPGEGDPACLGLAGQFDGGQRPAAPQPVLEQLGQLGSASPVRERHLFDGRGAERLRIGWAALGVDCFDSSSAQSRASIIPREW